MTTGPIKREGRYVNIKLKTQKERIKTNFHGQDSVYKQGKNYHPQVYVEECKHTDAENQQCSKLSDDDDDDDDNDDDDDDDDGFFKL